MAKSDALVAALVSAGSEKKRKGTLGGGVRTGGASGSTGVDEAWRRNRGVRSASNPGSGAEMRSGQPQESAPHWSDPGSFDYIQRNAERLANSVTNYGRGTFFMGVPKHGAVSHDQFDPD